MISQHNYKLTFNLIVLCPHTSIFLQCTVLWKSISQSCEYFMATADNPVTVLFSMCKLNISPLPPNHHWPNIKTWLPNSYLRNFPHQTQSTKRRLLFVYNEEFLGSFCFFKPVCRERVLTVVTVKYSIWFRWQHWYFSFPARGRLQYIPGIGGKRPSEIYLTSLSLCSPKNLFIYISSQVC